MDQIVRSARRPEADRSAHRGGARAGLEGLARSGAAGGAGSTRLPRSRSSPAAGGYSWLSQEPAADRLHHRAGRERRPHRHGFGHRHAAAADPGRHFERIVGRGAHRRGRREPARARRATCWPSSTRRGSPRRSSAPKPRPRRPRPRSTDATTTLTETEQALARAAATVDARHGRRPGAGDRDRRRATAPTAQSNRRGQPRHRPGRAEAAADRPREEHDLCADRRHRADPLGRSRPDGRLVAAGAGAVRHRRRPEAAWS